MSQTAKNRWEKGSRGTVAGLARERNIWKLAEAYRRDCPYSANELDGMVLFCQNNPDDPKREAYLVTLYWYYITDIFASIRRYSAPCGAYYTEEDIAGEAIVSFFEAIRTYSMDRGASFRTWVSNISKNTAITYMEKNSSKFYVTKSYVKKMIAYNRYLGSYEGEHGKMPPRELIQKNCHFSEQTLYNLERHRNLAAQEWSAGCDDFDSGSDSFEWEMDSCIMRAQIVQSVRRELKESLSEEEQRIICLRNGIGGDYHSIRETAQILHLDEGCIMAKELMIREKLKSNSRMRKLAQDLSESIQ